MKALLLALLLALPFEAGTVEIRQFSDPSQQQRYERLIDDLRCLVCQNQSLADSDADLARDLRDEVYQIIQSGQNEEEAIRFLTDRYGDFVLYRPPFKPVTLLLWGGPFLLLAAALFFFDQSCPPSLQYSLPTIVRIRKKASGQITKGDLMRALGR